MKENMKQLNAEMLVNACKDDSFDAGITIRADLEPLGGHGAPVKPATYAGGKFQTGKRWIDDTEGNQRSVDILVIDNEPSEANRLEAALLANRDELGLPDIVLDLSSESLPPHLPKELSIFQFPHRNADAYLRDSVMENGNQQVKFADTEIGKAIFSATEDHADALFAWCPQALSFGFWQSHLGKKGSQAKRARSWSSEIIGIEPAVDDIRILGVKGDPLNLNIDDKVSYDPNDPFGWTLVTSSKKTTSNQDEVSDTPTSNAPTNRRNTGKKQDSLSNIGHGQAPFGGNDAALAGVSFKAILQNATVSFASLRRVRVSNGSSAEARAVLVALGLVAHAAAFGNAFNLRSGADLRIKSQSWMWLGANDDEEIEPLGFDTAKSLFKECVERAKAVGLDVGDQWERNRISICPAPNLKSAIAKSWPSD